MVIILYERLNEQQHYVEHENAISSLAVSQSSFIASGEKGEDPKIHLWDVHTLKTIHVFQGNHKSDVYLLEFIKKDKYLVSCSLRTNTPVVVYDVKTRTVVFSYWVDELVRQVVPIYTKIQSFESHKVTHKYTAKNFILLSKFKAYYIKQNDLQSVLGLQNMKRFESLTEITAGISYIEKSADERTSKKEREMDSELSDQSESDKEEEDAGDYAEVKNASKR